jgi:hypothetical protein
MKRIYIAGKLNADAVGYLKNVHAMIRVAQAAKDAGFSVFVPCLDLLMGIVAGDYEYEDYATPNLAWLSVSDAVLLVPGWETSKGTQAEIARAKELGIPVFETLQELLTTLKGVV